MKRLTIVSIALVLLVVSFTLSGCSSTAVDDADAVAQQDVVVATTKEAPVLSWDGVWVTDPVTPGMEVTIKGALITVKLVDEDTKSLFWQGSWDSAAKATDGAEMVSKADVEALSSSIMGSSEKTKPFTYEDGVLSFDFSMMGTTKNVHTTKK